MNGGVFCGILIKSDLNVYDSKTPKSPIIKKEWEKLTERKFLQNKPQQIREIIQGYVDAHQL